MRSDHAIPQNIKFFCAILSPFTGEAEISRLRQCAQRGEVDWEKVAQYSNRANLAPALFYGLGQKGLLERVPPLLADYLGEIHRFNQERNQALRRQLLEVACLLNGVGITPLVLKGGAALVTDLFPDPAVRFMWDLDLMAPEESMGRAVDCLEQAGYAIPEDNGQESPATLHWAALHHYAPLARPGGVAAVELHRRLLSAPCGQWLSVEEVWRESSIFEGEQEGAQLALMSPTQALLHCFFHSQVHHFNHRYRRIDFRQLHHFAYVVCRYLDRIDWSYLVKLLDDPSVAPAFNAYRYLAEQLFSVSLPLPSQADRTAQVYFRRVMSCQQGWGRRIHVTRMLLADVKRAFSAPWLRRNLPADQDLSLSQLRLRHLRFLLGKYRRPVAWRRKSRGLV